MRALIPAILSAAALVAMPSLAGAKERVAPDAQLAKMLEGRIAGEPRKCISLVGTNSSTVIDKTAIVYRVGSTLWVNHPRSGAESLDEDDILVTRTIGSQLCSIDTVHLVDRAGHYWSGFVSLGEFVPYRKVETASAD